MSVLPGLEGYAGRDVALGQWDTHPEVARAFAKWCDIDLHARVLEPCAGIGNLVVALHEAGAVVHAIEIDGARAGVLAQREITASLRTNDFLALERGPDPFDLVAMNPPYEKDGETRFMLHGLTFAPRVCAIVRLVALASASRAAAWRSIEVRRLAVLVPRPVFAGSSGMDEIVFVEISAKRDGTDSYPWLDWLDWRSAAAQKEAT